MWYASAGGRLLGAPLAPRERRLALLRSLTTPAIFLISIPLAFLSSNLARYSWILIALVLVVSPRIALPHWLLRGRADRTPSRTRTPR
ncbi:hypothetical protein K2Z83_25995 [Oscillochloris sp. ZM17-4]|uniref:hypothetical protein n=1 Tax=Oscillochloris sp. ZM17-4 TaxID=2866714 RepID=UPI001C736795|nr:hypothetical protein [Oscillochloris sp. ZM17-4]MBX0331105.1 hypothetical protein [Oscillochloris sp. ZM17-4]